MRIGIDVQTTLGQKTGFGYYVSNLVKTLKKIDRKNQYFLFDPQSKKDLSTPKRLWWDQIAFPALCGKKKVDVIHQPCFSVPIFHQGKKIVTVHDLAIKHYPKGISFTSRNFFSFWMPFTYYFADHIISVSDYTKKDIMRLLRIPSEKITVIHLSIDKNLYNTKAFASKEVETVKNKFKIDTEYFLSICEFHPRKNLEFIIEIFGQNPQELGKYKLVLAGKKNKYYNKYYNKLLLLVKELHLEDKVIFTDYISDLEKVILYQNATALLFPSYYEGFGLPLLEAMACGCPVISSNTSSMPEIVGEGGILLSPTDKKGWAGAIYNIVNNPDFRKKIARYALSQSKKFSWEKCANTTLEVYKKVLGITQNEKNNILIIKNPFESQGFSGGEVHTMQIAHHLRENGHNVYFAGTCVDLLGAAKKDGFKTERLDFCGQEAVSEFSVLKFIFTWPWIYYRYKKFLKKMQEEKNINILYIISWNEKFLLAPLARKMGMKVFFVEHRLMGRYIFWNPFKFFYLHGTKFAKTIAVSRDVKQGLIKLGVNPKRIETIYNGVEIDYFLHVKEKLFIKKPDEIIIGTVCRLSKDKGVEYLLEGLGLALQKNPSLNLQLKIVGEGTEKDSLMALCQKLNINSRVEFMGRLEHRDIPKFLNSIDIFTLTSVWGESFGIALAEAGIMGKPSIASDIGGMPEIVENGKTGFIVPSKNSLAVSEAIIKLATDPKLIIKMGQAARQKIKNNFTIKTMLHKFDNLFNSDKTKG